MGRADQSVRSPARTAAAVERWFASNARALAWRTTPRDPYRSLVSEFMLQQTQVARVQERFGAFVARFPTVADLAGGDEADVLALWSGLGYYARARRLHACGRAIVERHGGRVPDEVADLRALPGVGAYTAGAIASVVFGRPEPAVDGNVTRVLLRLEARAEPVQAPATVRWAWAGAGDLVRASRDPGALVEGLMELGATVCTPRSPRCGACPLAGSCRARALGLAERIPAPKTVAPVKDLHCAVVVAADARGRLLVERRAPGGMWGGLWQAPTLERPDRAATRGEVLAFARARAVRQSRAFEHRTTHRRVLFQVWQAEGARGGVGRVRMSAAEIAGLGLSNPQRRILLGEEMKRRSDEETE